MRFSCPYCDHTLNLKNAKPGRFLPKCPKCARPFRLTVSDDPNRPPVVQPVEPEADESTAPTAVLPGETRDFVPEPADAKAADAAFSVASAAAPKERAAAKAPENVPSRLGGYQVLEELGRGGMGAVYLGRQLSLDRLVAVKVLKPEWAKNPTFVARFTREAYAAAQLVHHHVVQIYDIGADHGVHFFSMEFVKGRSLGDLVARQGKVDPEAAVGFALQAARGLKFGHDLGMIHRDVKPDNLLLNDQGVVKVADLGLVKVPAADEATADRLAEGRTGRPTSGLSSTADITNVGAAMGTPTYMAPEQARDATAVDERADVYSLGCTLYVLLTGKPPFEGKTVHEVLSKHATAPLVPPDAVVKRVPKALSEILLKMLAKKPEDRYPSMGAVIAALEQYLGVQSAGPFTPSEEHATAVEAAAKEFDEAPLARWRKRAWLGFFAGCGGLLLASLLLGNVTLAGGFLGLAVLTPLCYFVVSGVMEKTHLFSKVREFAFGSGWSDWLMAAVALVVFLIVLHLFGLLWIWAGFCAAAAALGAGAYFLLDRPLAAQRAGPVKAVEKLLRGMRLHGLEEQTLRQFVCKYSGRRWEEFYEALFGYEAKLAAREGVRGEAGKAAEKHAAWRDLVLGWVERRQQARQEARQRKHLQAVETKALEAKGMDAAEARETAEQMVEALVAQAVAIQRERANADAAQSRARMQRLVAAARDPKPVQAERAPRPRGPGLLSGLLGMVLGPKVRFLLGAALFAGFLLWLNQNEMLQREKLSQLGTDVAGKGDVQQGAVALEQKMAGLTKPLELPLVPASIAEILSGLNAGVAGLLLLLSAFFRGWKVSLLVLPGAAVALLGHRFGVPGFGPLGPALVSMAAGMGLAVLGFIFLRSD